MHWRKTTVKNLDKKEIILDVLKFLSIYGKLKFASIYPETY